MNQPIIESKDARKVLLAAERSKLASASELAAINRLRKAGDVAGFNAAMSALARKVDALVTK